jgi:actin-like ATPase involved in cell morphogenesis
VSDLQVVKQRLVEAGLEIYRTKPAEIEIAERVRLHIMDSGVRVRGDMTVSFTVRSQRSDFGAGISSDQLFEKVREAVGPTATAHGYCEEAANTVSVRDPMDEHKVLDTWHEVVYIKLADTVEAVVEEVRWALEIEKYVAP